MYDESIYFEKIRVLMLRVVLGLFITYLQTGDCNNPKNAESITFDIPPYVSWESTYTKIKEAKTEAEIFQASEDYRNCGRNETNEIFHDIVQFLCAVKVTRMGIDEAYTKDVCPNTSSTLATMDVNVAAKDWANFLRENKTDGLASKIREAYKYMIPFNESEVDEFALSVCRNTDLCRRYECKIPEFQATYESNQKCGIKTSFEDILKNYTDWSMTVDDFYDMNRMREALELQKLQWAFLDEDRRLVIPYCPSQRQKPPTSR